MSGKKTIKINPKFFNKGNKTKKRERKQKPVLEKSMKPNNIKKQLLQKIKQHQQKTIDMNREHVSKEDKEFQNNFSNSMGYLQKMIAEKKKKRKKRATIKNTPKNFSNKKQSVVQPPNIVSSKPSWGCLKNGNLPTYSQFKKTLKHKETDKIQLTSAPEKPIEKSTGRQDKLSRLKDKFSTEKNKQKLEKLQKIKKKILEKNKTIKLYKLGKRKKENNIGVLIKSGKTRKIIKDEILVLKQKSIMEIKVYLRKHNIIKTGSTAPESVLRKIYEDSYLAGDIYNKNSENLLHNYINK